MVEHIALGVAVLVAVILGIVVYYKVLMSYMTTYADSVGKSAELQASSGWTWFTTKLKGWKTVIMAGFGTFFGGIAAIPADALQTIISLPTTMIVYDQKIAMWVTTLIVSLIPIVHAQGVAHAASTPPQDTGD